MKQYLELMDHILKNGTHKGDRTGTGTLSVFGHQMRFDLSEGFPLVTTKKCHLKSIIHELLWFLKGDTNIDYLNKHDVKIWDAWATKEGDLGPIYGAQWRSWPNPDGSTTDQVKALVESLRTNPDSRRHIVSAWNPSVLPDEGMRPQNNVLNGKMALPPCHVMFQFYVANGELSCQLYQRSADVFLGVPFNIASYSLLTMMLAQVCGLKPGEFIHTFGDAHLYLNHISQAKIQLHRKPYPKPVMRINPAITNISHFTYADFALTGYGHHPHISAPISI